MNKFTFFYPTRVCFGEETAEAGLDALESFIKECGLPTRMNQLKSMVEITRRCCGRLRIPATLSSAVLVSLTGRKFIRF